MRLEARALDGDETITALVPLRSMLKFKKDTKHGVDWWIRSTRDPESEVDSIDWEPRLAWQAIVDTTDDTRSFEEWSEQVEWAGIWSATDELDPSGGEETPTPEPSPASSSTPDADGPSSSTSTTSSNTPSGEKSTE